MSFEIKGLKERYGKLIKECRAISEKAEKEDRNLNAEEVAADKKLNDDVDDVRSRIERLERIEESEKLIGTPADESRRTGNDGTETAITPEERDLAFRYWALRGSKRVPSPAMKAAAERCNAPLENEIGILGYNGFGYGDFRSQFLRGREQRADMTLTAAVGGYTVPQGFVYNLELALLAYGGVRQCADVFRTATGNDTPWPTCNDTGNKGALLAEDTTISTSVNPTIGVRTFKAYKMSSTPILISFELLQDTAFDLGSQIGAMLGERIGRCEADYYTTGTGSSQPQGCIAGSTAATLSTGVATTASATAIAADELIDLFHSIDPAYREGPNVRFAFNDAIARYLRKLKDGDGNYLWTPGLTAGVSDTLLGKRVQINQSMASTITAGDKTVQFGDFGKFKIRDVAEVRLVRLVERYADLDMVGFIAFHRTDSAVLDAGTHPLKHLVQHA
jgi:HK97 family phage major capsid protein